MNTTRDPVVRLLERLGTRLHNAPVLRRLHTPGGVTVAALFVISAQLAVRAWATTRSWFMWDDYIFIADVANGAPDFAWLFRSHFSLVQPVGFAMVSAVGKAGFAWPVYAFHILVLQLLASIACWLMLRVVFGNDRRILLPLVFYLFVPLTVPGNVWWSVAIYQWPFHIALFGAIATHVVWLRNRRTSALIGTLAFLALGLGSYVKAPLIVAVLFGISALWFTAGPLRNRARELATQWPAWAGQSVLVSGYLWLWSSRQLAAPPRQACELGSAVQISTLETMGTAFTGGPLSWRLWTGGIDPFVAASNCVPQVYRGAPDLVVGGAPQSLATPPLALVALSATVLILLVAHRWARHRNALLGLWILLPYTIASIAFVYAGRAATFGSQVSAREIRYFADLAVIGAFVLAAALLPIAGAAIRPSPRPEPFITRGLPPALIMWSIAAFVAMSMISTVTYALPWHSQYDARTFPERVFVANVKASIAASGQPQIDVADVPLPASVANPVIYPYNLPSRKLAPFAPQLNAVTQGTDLKVLDPRGDIRNAAIPDAPRTRPGPVEGCGYLVKQQKIAVQVTQVAERPVWVRMDYFASDSGFLDVTAGPMFRRVTTPSGLHTMYFLSDGDFSSVELTASNALSVCVDSIHTGPIVASDEGSS